MNGKDDLNIPLPRPMVAILARLIRARDEADERARLHGATAAECQSEITHYMGQCRTALDVPEPFQFNQQRLAFVPPILDGGKTKKDEAGGDE